jgi:hypothetical protein
MEKKELWHEMLTTYRNLMRYENGITLPNMIGAYYLYDSSIDLSSCQCAVRVLKEILDSRKAIGVLINDCNNIHKYILSVADTHLKNPALNYKIFSGLYDKKLQEHLSSVDELGNHLYSIHREEIILKKFSFRDGSWHELSAIEIQHINNIIKSL